MRTLLILLLFPLLAQADVCRDDRGRICRSKKVIRQFMHENPCPSTGSVKRCKTHTIDHIQPLCSAKTEEERRRLDSLDNLQWQTKADAKEKDKWERRLCGGDD